MPSSLETSPLVSNERNSNLKSKQTESIFLTTLSRKRIVSLLDRAGDFFQELNGDIRTDTRAYDPDISSWDNIDGSQLQWCLQIALEA